MDEGNEGQDKFNGQSQDQKFDCFVELRNARTPTAQAKFGTAMKKIALLRLTDIFW